MIPRESASPHPQASRRVRALAALAALACALTTPGCFDGGALVDRQRAETNRVRLDEVDIGKFRITLPHTAGERGPHIVDFHAFGQVAHRDRDKVAEALKLNAPELRYRVLLLVRAMSHGELDEPRLETLRQRLADVANAALEKKLVKHVGFYRFTFTTM
jgi:hypothetical protein